MSLFSLDTMSSSHLFACPRIRFRALASVLIALSMRVELALLFWIEVNSPLCAFRMNGSVRVNANRLKCSCFLLVSAYASTSYRSPKARGELYRGLFLLIRSVHSTNDVIIDGDFSAQLCCLAEAARHIGISYFLSLPASLATKIDLLKFFLTIDCFWRTSIFTVKNEVSSFGALLCLPSVRLRLITLPSFVVGVDQLMAYDHFGPHSCFSPCSLLFAPDVATLTKNPRFVYSCS